MIPSTRQQLSLFLDEKEAISIEKIRVSFNPIQKALIQSHITLCREDEIEDNGRLLVNLRKLSVKPFALILRSPERFADGKGVYIPVVDEVTIGKISLIEQLASEKWRTLEEFNLAN